MSEIIKFRIENDVKIIDCNLDLNTNSLLIKETTRQKPILFRKNLKKETLIKKVINYINSYGYNISPYDLRNTLI